MNRGGGYRGPYLPVWPLLREARARGTRPLHETDPLRRSLVRSKARGRITPETADNLAVRWLGVHPGEIWSEWFELDAAGDE